MSGEDLTPAELYRAISIGHNTAAEAQLYRNLRRNEWFYLLKHAGLQDAEDVLNSAWVIVKEAITAKKIEHGEKVFAYAHGVIRRLCAHSNEDVHLVPREMAA